MLVGGFKKFIWGPLAFCFFFLVSMILMCKCPRRRSSKKAKAPRAIPSARNLMEAGIKFKKKDDTEKPCCLNVSFDEESGKLEIPFLSLQHSSISSFRNLIAFEQCCSKGIQTSKDNKTHEKYYSKDVQAQFTAYATFMDNIIDTPEDVEILVRHGIIESKLGTDEDVASLFNNICKGATLNYEHHYLTGLFKRVNNYCDSDRHRWRAALVNSHFHSPWAVASVLVAVALLLLTFGATIWQTIYTVRSYNMQLHQSPPSP